MAGNFEIKFDKFKVADKAVAKGLSQALAALGFAIQDRAVDNIQQIEAIDTGAMRASVYVDTDGVPGRESAVAAAIREGANVGQHSGKPHLETVIAEEGTKVDGPNEVKVGVCVNYGIYVEMGVEGAFGIDGLNFQPRPYLSPAAEEVRGEADVVTRRFIQDAINTL